jgi:hypothetical protein
MQYSSPAVGTEPVGYQYKEAAARFKAPFYQPPTRAWGYDVGLLSQTPDLFSRRIALPEAGTPNEFFREVSRDDPWVRGLLCAAQERNGNMNGRLLTNHNVPPLVKRQHLDPNTISKPQGMIADDETPTQTTFTAINAIGFHNY